MADVTLKQVMDYFNYTSMKEFREDWNKLSDAEKAEFREGVGKAFEAAES